eukprot:6471370-Amphidinium_carterae.1
MLPASLLRTAQSTATMLFQTFNPLGQFGIGLVDASCWSLEPGDASDKLICCDASIAVIDE